MHSMVFLMALFVMCQGYIPQGLGQGIDPMRGMLMMGASPFGMMTPGSSVGSMGALNPSLGITRFNSGVGLGGYGSSPFGIMSPGSSIGPIGALNPSLGVSRLNPGVGLGGYGGGMNPNFFG